MDAKGVLEQLIKAKKVRLTNIISTLKNFREPLLKPSVLRNAGMKSKVTGTASSRSCNSWGGRAVPTLAPHVRIPGQGEDTPVRCSIYCGTDRQESMERCNVNTHCNTLA